MKKRCTKCGGLKVLASFPLAPRMKDGHDNRCKRCESRRSLEYALLNKKQKSLAHKIWYAKNRAHVLSYRRQWLADNPGINTAYWMAYETAKLRAMPPWVNKKEVKKIYTKAARLGLTVDHKIPLRGRGVCGLHVPWNLQLLSKSANSSKGNKLPDERSAATRPKSPYKS